MNTKGLLFLITALLLLGACNNGPDWQYDPGSYAFDYPLGLPPMAIPDDNPMTIEGVALGRMLFYDPILSADNTQSCGSCHNQADAFSDNGNQFSTGIDGLEGDKNAMQIINSGYGQVFFWDGRSASMEEQALQPVLNPIEMHNTWEDAVVALKADAEYPRLFFEAFGTEDITSDLATKAIAQFERTLLSGNSIFDKFRASDPSSGMTSSIFNGLNIFFSERGDCFHCHGEPFFTSHMFHNNGLDSVFTEPDWGLYNVTGIPADIGKFKSPTLRNIAETAPYMHDGRFETLEEVVEHYNSGVLVSPTVDPLMTKPGKEFGLGLTAEEKTDLVNFLKALSDPDFLTKEEFSDPF